MVFVRWQSHFSARGSQTTLAPMESSRRATHVGRPGMRVALRAVLLRTAKLWIFLTRNAKGGPFHPFSAGGPVHGGRPAHSPERAPALPSSAAAFDGAATALPAAGT